MSATNPNNSIRNTGLHTAASNSDPVAAVRWLNSERDRFDKMDQDLIDKKRQQNQNKGGDNSSSDHTQQQTQHGDDEIVDEATRFRRWSHELHCRTSTGTGTTFVRGDTALTCAARKGSLPVVELLLAAGLSPCATVGDYNKFTPLMIAVQQARASAEIVEALIAGGARVNQRDHYRRRTALHYAAEKPSNTHLVVVCALLEDGGADVWAKDNTGDTALHVAVKQVRSEASARNMWDHSAQRYADHWLRVCFVKNQQGRSVIEEAKRLRANNSEWKWLTSLTYEECKQKYLERQQTAGSAAAAAAAAATSASNGATKRWEEAEARYGSNFDLPPHLAMLRKKQVEVDKNAALSSEGRSGGVFSTLKNDPALAALVSSILVSVFAAIVPVLWRRLK